MVGSPFGVYDILQVLSVIFQSLLLVFALVGFVWSVIWFRDAGLSAKLAAVAFGLQGLVQLGSFAQDYFFETGWTFYTPYSSELDSRMWLSIGWYALLFSCQLLAVGLGIGALVVTWRRQRSAARDIVA